MTPKTTFAGGLTTIWPQGYKVPHIRSKGTMKEKCKLDILETIQSNGPQTSKTLEAKGVASLDMIQAALRDLFDEGLVTRSRNNTRETTYFYEVKRD